MGSSGTVRTNRQKTNKQTPFTSNCILGQFPPFLSKKFKNIVVFDHVGGKMWVKCR